MVLLCALLLVACAIALVSAQFRARTAFVDLERAQWQGRELVAEGDRLRIALQSAAQPAAIEAAARTLGLGTLAPERTVVLPIRAVPYTSSPQP